MLRSLLLLSLCASLSAAGLPPLRLEIQPHVTTAPGVLHTRVWVERAAENRKLVIEITGPNYYRSTDVQIDGDAAPRMFEFWRQDLPCGPYQVSAILQRNDGRSAVVSDRLRVLGPSCEEPTE